MYLCPCSCPYPGLLGQLHMIQPIISQKQVTLQILIFLFGRGIKDWNFKNYSEKPKQLKGEEVKILLFSQPCQFRESEHETQSL